MILVSTSFTANKSLEEIRSFLFQLKNDAYTDLDEIKRSKKLEKKFERELGSAPLSSVTKPRLTSIYNRAQYKIPSFRTMMCVVNKKSLKVEFFNNFMDKAALTDGISIIKFYEALTFSFLVPVWKACRASCAVPLFFTSFNDYVDGGVMANNPCEYAMAAISRYNFSQMEVEPEFSLAVSMGTGHDPQMEVENINTFDEKISGRMKITVDLFSKNVSNLPV